MVVYPYMEYYLAITRIEVLTHVTTRGNLESVKSKKLDTKGHIL